MITFRIQQHTNVTGQGLLSYCVPDYRTTLLASRFRSTFPETLLLYRLTIMSNLLHSCFQQPFFVLGLRLQTLLRLGLNPSRRKPARNLFVLFVSTQSLHPCIVDGHIGFMLHDLDSSAQQMLIIEKLSNLPRYSLIFPENQRYSLASLFMFASHLSHHPSGPGSLFGHT